MILSVEERQFNVELPTEVIAAVYDMQSKRMRETKQKIKTKTIVRQALSLWFSIDGLGIFEAIEKAKIEKARVVLMEKTASVELNGETVAKLFKAVRDAQMIAAEGK